ncbi:DUF397 domain-containing protein [Actinomadura rugatobispora]|uniref:DUF397 domain-containing protein n=1 Tax=Actinomadura rugatobispora TaxID=1994 RepID=A0ABW1AHB5_9ACTN|nr:hypothetical protein GCM10010200_109600 [Actinomadura rugatobispora]
MSEPTMAGRPAKPAADELGVDLRTLDWRRAAGGAGGAGAVEVAFTGPWVLLRTEGDGGHVSVFDHHEWDCFVQGAKAGEFDRAAT